MLYVITNIFLHAFMFYTLIIFNIKNSQSGKLINWKKQLMLFPLLVFTRQETSDILLEKKIVAVDSKH